MKIPRLNRRNSIARCPVLRRDLDDRWCAANRFACIVGAHYNAYGEQIDMLSKSIQVARREYRIACKRQPLPSELV